MACEGKNMVAGVGTVAVVIPCFRVKRHILGVLGKIGPEVSKIYLVDDCCPDETGKLVQSSSSDSRVTVIYNHTNLGVGGATIAGYRHAIAEGAEIIVKIDGDGQMDPELISTFVEPIRDGIADYTKGNRFFFLEDLQQMPLVRVFGNAALSFMAKLSTGYWDLFDPTNGYTAIHAKVAARLPLEKIDNRFFFESDLLFRLNLLRAVVMDVPIRARYADEKSNLKVLHSIPEFFGKHFRNLVKRIFYTYYLRDFSVVSLEIAFGLPALTFGIIFGLAAWIRSVETGVAATSGTVMLAALPVMVGVQLLFAFFAADGGSMPRQPLHKRI